MVFVCRVAMHVRNMIERFKGDIRLRFVRDRGLKPDNCLGQFIMLDDTYRPQMLADKSKQILGEFCSMITSGEAGERKVTSMMRSP